MSQISFHIADHQTETMLYQFCMWIWIFPVECKRHCHYCAQQHLSDKCHQIPRQRYFVIRKNQNIYWINSNLIHNYRNYIKYSMLKIRRFSRSLVCVYVLSVCVSRYAWYKHWMVWYVCDTRVNSSHVAFWYFRCKHADEHEPFYLCMVDVVFCFRRSFCKIYRKC